MRYLREHIGSLGKSAHAYEDTITDVDVGEHLVSITSRQHGMLRVVSQFTRAEMQLIVRQIQQVEAWERSEHSVLGSLRDRLLRLFNVEPPPRHRSYNRLRRLFE